MKTIFLTLLFIGASFAQDSPYRIMGWMGGDGAVYATDLNGTDEYMSNASPVNLDLNDTNRVVTPENDFEADTSNWTGNGNHTIDSTTVSPLTGTYSGLIVATGVGDVDSCASLPAADFTALEHGKKYTFQMQVEPTSTTPDLTLQIGDSSWTWENVDTSTLVQNFEWDTTGNPTPDIQLFLSQPDAGFRIDEVDLSEAYDISINQWVRASLMSANMTPLFGYGAYTTVVAGFLLRVQSSGRAQISLCDGDAIYAEVSNAGDVTLNTWTLISATANRVGNSTIYINGIAIGSPLDITALGTVRQGSSGLNFRIGREQSAGYWNGYIGETQIVRGYALTTAEILANYNLGIKGKPMAESYLGGTIISWWKWAGGTDTIFLQDEEGNNDLTGTKVTQADDQIKVSKYKD